MIFLFLSAYGLELSFLARGKVQPGRYWKRRLVTAFLPYGIAETAAILAGLYGQVSFRTYLMDIMLIHPLLPIGWFMNYLLFWYIAFFLVHLLIRRSEKLRLLTFLIISAALAIYYIPTSDVVRPQFSFIYFAGILAADRKHSFDRFTTKRAVTIEFLIAAAALAIKQLPYLRSIPGYVVMNCIDLTIKTASLPVLIVLFTALGNGKGRLSRCYRKLFTVIGGFAFELYIIHGLAWEIWRLDLPVYAYQLIFWPLSFAGAYVYHVLIRYLKGKLILNG